jgi:flavin-binding protein dodecin
MSPVYKSVDLVGTSKKNFEDAVRNAYEEATKTLRGIRNITVEQQDLKVREDKNELIWRVRVRVSFEVEQS